MQVQPQQQKPFLHHNSSSPYPERPARSGIALNGQIYSKTAIAEKWLGSLVEKWCDFQPDESHVHLPFGLKQDVYDLYKRYY
jgi:hypothetical protein